MTTGRINQIDITPNIHRSRRNKPTYSRLQLSLTLQIGGFPDPLSQPTYSRMTQDSSPVSSKCWCQMSPYTTSACLVPHRQPKRDRNLKNSHFVRLQQKPAEKTTIQPSFSYPLRPLKPNRIRGREAHLKRQRKRQLNRQSHPHSDPKTQPDQRSRSAS